MKEKLTKFWKERNEREKKVLLFASVFLIASLLYAFVWLPGEKAAKRLRAELPVMRSKLAAMKSEALEIERLRKRSPDVRGDIREALAVSAKADKIGLGRVDTESDGHVHAEFDGVPFNSWIAWLEKLELEDRINLESAHIQKLDDKGNVKVVAIFGRQS